MRTDLIRPLCTAENDFLQVLFPRFLLRRHDDGVALKLAFGGQTPAIWTREAKRHLLTSMPAFKRKSNDYQKRLDEFLVEGKRQRYEFNDPAFLFRYGSGGTLPVLRIGKRQYYALFYREVHPIGWNIANGGCDSREELLNPIDAIERELREELIIVDPKHHRRYVFSSDAGKPLDRPEFAVARRFWQERFPQLEFTGFEELEIPLKWLPGPDSLTVRIDKDTRTTEGVFLNINAADFGIEVDRVAKINVDEDALLLDGEIIGGRLLNRAVGLFEVQRLHRALALGATEYVPDFFYYDGRKSEDGTAFKRDIRKYVRARLKGRELAEFKDKQDKLDLCPVTRRIIARHLSAGPEQETDDSTRSDYDVFISFASEDRRLAQRAFDFLRGRYRKRIFFSGEKIHDSDFSRAIDDALDSSRALVAVGSNPRNLRKEWVEYEWRSFHNDICNRRKDRNAQLIPFIQGFNPVDLPRPLRHREAVEFNPHKPDAGLRQLATRVR